MTNCDGWVLRYTIWPAISRASHQSPDDVCLSLALSFISYLVFKQMQAEYNRKGDLDAGGAAESDALELSTDSKIKCKIWQGGYVLKNMCWHNDLTNILKAKHQLNFHTIYNVSEQGTIRQALPFCHRHLTRNFILQIKNVLIKRSSGAWFSAAVNQLSYTDGTRVATLMKWCRFTSAQDLVPNSDTSSCTQR